MDVHGSVCASGRTLNPRVARFRSLLLRRGAVSPRVHLPTHQTFSPVLRPPAGFCRKTPELPGQGLPPVSTVTVNATDVDFRESFELKMLCSGT